MSKGQVSIKEYNRLVSDGRWGDKILSFTKMKGLSLTAQEISDDFDKYCVGFFIYENITEGKFDSSEVGTEYTSKFYFQLNSDYFEFCKIYVSRV